VGIFAINLPVRARTHIFPVFCFWDLPLFITEDSAYIEGRTESTPAACWLQDQAEPYISILEFLQKTGDFPECQLSFEN